MGESAFDSGRHPEPLATCAWSHLPEVASPNFLKLMLKIHSCLEDSCESRPGVLAQSFARIWGWLVHEVPAPPPGTALFLHGIGVSDASPICVAERPACGLPAVYVPSSLQQLLTRLSISALLLVIRLLLLEQKVLFVSSSVAFLTTACEAFSSILLFPLAWVHCYNPLLPSMDYLATPPPFLFGCLRDIFLKDSFADSHDLLSSEILAEPDRDFSIFDLDTGRHASNSGRDDERRLAAEPAGGGAEPAEVQPDRAALEIRGLPRSLAREKLQGL